MDFRVPTFKGREGRERGEYKGRGKRGAKGRKETKGGNGRKKKGDEPLNWNFWLRHWCRVAGDAVWSHTAGDAPLFCDGFFAKRTFTTFNLLCRSWQNLFHCLSVDVEELRQGLFNGRLLSQTAWSVRQRRRHHRNHLQFTIQCA